MILHLAALKFHGIPWNFPWHSTELSDMSFGGTRVPWNSMAYSMEFHGTNWYFIWRHQSSMEFHGIFHGIPWKPCVISNGAVLIPWNPITVVQLRKYKLCTVLPIWRTPHLVNDFCGQLFGSVASYLHLRLIFCKYEMFTMVKCHLSVILFTQFFQLSPRLFERRARY